jgi:hypothetical protein
MKNYLISLIAFILLGFASLGSAATYNFVDEANLHVEQGYVTFDSDLHSHAYMPGGLEITASNGGNLSSFATELGAQPVYKEYYPYMDSHWKQDAGLGVCQTLTDSCGSDDNQQFGEYIHMVFDDVVNILSLDITGDHEAVVAGTQFWYSLDQGVTWDWEDIGGQIVGAALDLNVDWMTKTLDYTILPNQADVQIYLSSMTVSPVPVPAAVWLFGTAMIGLVGFSKRRKVA